MPGARSEILGMKEARQKLQNLDAAVQRHIGLKGLNAAARLFAAEMSRRAKVSSRGRDPTRGSLKAAPKAGKARKTKRAMATVAIVIDDPAAVPQELGLARRNYPAQPFARPAVDSKRDEAAQLLADTIKAEIDAVAKG